MKINNLKRAVLLRKSHLYSANGQGTDLELSLSYEIVKAHSGELKVATGEGGGSTFIIQL